jgi:TldD protein
MTNTYIDAGEHHPAEIIAETNHGVYIQMMAGGQAELAKGDFVFSAIEAYLIEDGKLTAPLRGATVMGNGPKALSEIDMVGTDLMLDPGFGRCGGVGPPASATYPFLPRDRRRQENTIPHEENRTRIHADSR